ncbi:MAG: metalloprotease PmbA [Gammaproteobacteria bacterium]|nr:metalloprotease PmbA [Gammaproteobacteria bacterium]
MNEAAITAPALDQADLEELVADVLAHAKSCGASQAEAGASLENGLTASVRLGEVDTLEYQRDRGLGVTVYFGQRKGSASSADLSQEALHATVEKACSIARFTAADEFAGLADAARMPVAIPDLDLCHPWPLAPEAAIDLATRCEAAALAVDSRIENSEGATVSTHQGLRAYGNSHGFIGSLARTHHELSCVVLGRDEQGMQRDYWYTAARDPVELEEAADVGEKAARRALQRLGSRKIGTCTAPVLFAAEIARGLLGHFLGAIRGGSQYRRASFLLDAEGQQIFPGFVTIHERPHIPKAVASAPFDAEGVATSDRQLVAGGVLQGYVLDSYAARKLGRDTTGNAGGVHNLLVSDTGQDRDGLLRAMERGLLVTELMGQGVNGVTGDYSRGAAGFWVEDGAPAYPVHEITIAGNLRDMLANLVAIGKDVDRRGAVRTGSILVERMTIAGG